MAGIRIAFIGKPNSGQWEAAIYLKKKYNFKRLRFIDGPSRVLKFLYNAGIYQRFPWKLLRQMYDSLYKIDPNIWITYMENKLKTTTRDVVIPDAHYLNEIERLRSLGFVIIRVSATKDNVARSIGRYLGKDITPGTVTISEYFNTDNTRKTQVAYSIFFEDRVSFHKTLDEILLKLQNT